MDSNHNIKLVDFGFATSFYAGEKMTVFCGSPDYAAPELIDSRPYYGPDVVRTNHFKKKHTSSNHFKTTLPCACNTDRVPFSRTSGRVVVRST